MEVTTEVISGSMQFIESIANKIAKFGELKKNQSLFLRLLYMEVCNNIEILSVCDLRKFRAWGKDTDKLKALIKQLKIDMSEAVFYSDENGSSKIYEKLCKKGQVKNLYGALTTRKNDKEIQANSKFIYENVLQALSFIVNKIQLLRSISEMTTAERAILKDMYIDTRLINILQRLQMVHDVMQKMPEIKDMAR